MEKITHIQEGMTVPKREDLEALRTLAKAATTEENEAKIKDQLAGLDSIYAYATQAGWNDFLDIYIEAEKALRETIGAEEEKDLEKAA